MAIFKTLTFGQSIATETIDSLQGKSYEYFNDKLQSEEIDVDVEKVYSAAYLKKAKREKNLQEIFAAYKVILHHSEKQNRIFYADSMILVAKKLRRNDLIGSAYLTKGILYYDKKSHINALDNYLQADHYISQGDDKYLVYKVKYNIAQIKYYLGYYEEAIALLLDCVQYFKSNYPLPYLSSLHSLGLCYDRIGRLDLSAETNQMGIKEADRLNLYQAIPRFVHSEGINQYYKENYNISLAKLSESLPELSKHDDFSSIAVTNFYLGKNYWALKQHEKAVGYFVKVDESFIQNQYLRPDLREAYEFLIEYYIGVEDEYRQKIYMKQLLIVDQFLSQNYKYLSQKIHKEYDTKKLLAAIVEIEKEKGFSKTTNFISSILIFILLLTTGFLFYRSAIFKQKKNLMISKRPKTEKEFVHAKARESIGINADVVQQLIAQLETFELEKKYLAKDITLPRLAEMFDSNIVYVSKIISHHKHKKSVDYINDLRIDFIVNMLDNSSKFRNYTNKALGEEAGFSTTQNFTRAFGKTMGMSPTDYIKKVNKKFKT
ncbi:MAG: AraC family transcriptional regulator [Flavobacterium sp.]